MIDGNIIKGIFDIGVNFFDRYEKWQTIGDNADAKVRMLYLECRRNLSLLDCVSEKENKNDNSALLQVATILETGILEMVFMEGEINKKMFGLLTHLPKPPIATKSDVQKIEKVRTVVELAMSIYIKIFVLKKLGKIKDKGAILKNIQYRKRLKNIKADILWLLNWIQGHKAIKQIKSSNIDENYRKISF